MIWLASCAVSPVLHFDSTLFFGQFVDDYPKDPLLTFENLERLNRLVWFSEGNMPENARKALLTWLKEEHLDILLRIRQAWKKILENNLAALQQLAKDLNEPPFENSAAYDDLRMALLVNHLALDDLKDEKMPPKERRQLERELQERTLLFSPDFVALELLEQANARDLEIQSQAEAEQAKPQFSPLWNDWWWQLPLFLIGCLGIWGFNSKGSVDCLGGSIEYHNQTYCLNTPQDSLTFLEHMFCDTVYRRESAIINKNKPSVFPDDGKDVLTLINKTYSGIDPDSFKTLLVTGRIDNEILKQSFRLIRTHNLDSSSFYKNIPIAFWNKGVRLYNAGLRDSACACFHLLNMWRWRDSVIDENEREFIISLCNSVTTIKRDENRQNKSSERPDLPFIPMDEVKTTQTPSVLPEGSVTSPIAQPLALIDNKEPPSVSSSQSTPTTTTQRQGRENLYYNLPFFNKQAIVYQRLLDANGLGQLLRVEKVRIRPSKNLQISDSTELELFLLIQSTDLDTAIQMWKSDKNNFDKENNQSIEEWLFIRFKQTMKIPSSQGNIQIYVKDAQGQYIPCFYVFAWEENGKIISESKIDCKAQKASINNLDLEEIEWAKAKAINTLEGYQEILRRFPNGKYKEVAINKIRLIQEEESLWRTAFSLNTKIAYEEYLQKCQLCKYKNEAQVFLKNKAIQLTITMNGVNIAKGLTQVPSSPQKIINDISIFMNARFLKTSCDNTRPKISEIEKTESKLEIQVSDLCKEVLTDETKSLWCIVMQNLGLNCNDMHRELLTFYFNVNPNPNGYNLYISINGKFGSGVFKPKNSDYMDMEVDFSDYLSNYSRRINQELIKYLLKE